MILIHPVSISPSENMEVAPILRVNAVFGWMPCHILQQKKLNIFPYIYISCYQLSPLRLLPCFLTSVLHFPMCSGVNVKLNLFIKEHEKAIAAFLFDIHIFVYAAVLQRPFCIPSEGRSTPSSVGDAEWLEWRLKKTQLYSKYAWYDRLILQNRCTSHVWNAVKCIYIYLT